jgi:polyferredoxin
MAAVAAARPHAGRLSAAARATGEWLARHQRLIRHMQWSVVLVYLVLVAVPALLPLPGNAAHLWNNLTLFAQFAFWGVWWPFVLLSMVLVGRAWCGLFCPEGALSEAASEIGPAHHVPRWLTWRGWPFVAFALTTIYGQMVSVYQYPRPALLILGGSTLGALTVGYLYGRRKRVWCRYLCPVNGVFALLAKLAPFHFRVDRDAWEASQRAGGRGVHPVNCAPLVPIRTMQSASLCHMCGRCSGFREAIALEPRSPNHEIVHLAGRQSNPWETALILFGLMGIATGAFHWTASPWFVAARQLLAHWLISHRLLWPLETSLPWWILTDYPDRNDVLSLLDGALLLGYIALTALVLGTALSALLALGTRIAAPWSWARFHHLAQALVPLDGCGVFLGLSALTVTLLRDEGLRLAWVGSLRACLLAGASLWSLWLGWRVIGGWTPDDGHRRALRHLTATGVFAGAVALAAGSWAILFWVW